MSEKGELANEGAVRPTRARKNPGGTNTQPANQNGTVGRVERDRGIYWATVPPGSAAEPVREEEIVFVVPGRAVGKQRPRAAGMMGADGRMRNKIYTPAKTVHYESFVALCYQAEMRRAHRPLVPLTCPVTVDVVAYFGIPASMPKRERAKLAKESSFYPKKPDSDNVLKAILDGLNGVAYKDDKLVVGCSVQKMYGNYERTVVTIRTRG